VLIQAACSNRTCGPQKTSRFFVRFCRGRVLFCRKMTPDSELLRRYSDDHSEEAFTELVRRHLDLVYSAALRQVNGDAHLAQDVAQTVFTDLARKARALSRHPVLSGWLYTSARFAAAKVARTEHRRRAREEKAQTMREIQDEPTLQPDSEALSRVLDDAMHQLKQPEREALLLRFFENQKLAEIGGRLGLSENAARMKIERALEKLRGHLAHRGVTTTGVALAAALSSQAVQGAPVGLATSIAGASLAGAGAGGALGALEILIMTKSKSFALAAVLAALLATPLVIQHQAQAAIRAQNDTLRAQVVSLPQVTAENQRLSNLVARARAAKRSAALSLPAPAMKTAAASPEPSAEELQARQMISRMVKGEDGPRLTAEQIEKYLEQNRRNAASLLTAFRATSDRKFLQEALEKYPTDPQVNFAAVFDKDAPAEERRRRLDSFKKAAPDNALANYASALDYFKAGQVDQAAQELTDAYGKKHFEDYSLSFIQSGQEAWLAAGYSPAEAKTINGLGLLLPHLAAVKELSENIITLAQSYRQSGDEASAQAALLIAANMGQRFDGGPGQSIISQLVGFAVQKNALATLDPAAPYGDSGQTVQEHLDELMEQRDAMKKVVQQTSSLMENLSPQEWISYQDRWRSFGEEAALNWLAAKHGLR